MLWIYEEITIYAVTKKGSSRTIEVHRELRSGLESTAADVRNESETKADIRRTTAVSPKITYS
jgi:hypothetical protein